MKRLAVLSVLVAQLLSACGGGSQLAGTPAPPVAQATAPPTQVPTVAPTTAAPTPVPTPTPLNCPVPSGRTIIDSKTFKFDSCLVAASKDQLAKEFAAISQEDFKFALPSPEGGEYDLTYFNVKDKNGVDYPHYSFRVTKGCVALQSQVAFSLGSVRLDSPGETDYEIFPRNKDSAQVRPDGTYYKAGGTGFYLRVISAAEDLAGLKAALVTTNITENGQPLFKVCAEMPTMKIYQGFSPHFIITGLSSDRDPSVAASPLKPVSILQSSDKRYLYCCK